MFKLKHLSISLAAKCQLLFGLAVLVIIAGALAVPWQRMEQLAKQPNVDTARYAADMHFREIHANVASTPASRPTTIPSLFTTSPASWDQAHLVETAAGGYPPRIFLAPSPIADLIQTGEEDTVATRALKTFRDHPQETGTGEVGAFKDKNGETQRVYRYAAAIRLQASCLNCHAEFNAFTPAAATQSSAPSTQSSNKPSTQSSVLGPQSSSDLLGVIRVDVPFQTDENQLLLNRIVIVVAGMLGGALAIVVFYLITSRLILQPVRVLKNTAEKVAKGDLNIRSAISTGDEFQQLSEMFNTMLVTLKGSQDQLESTNRSLDTRVGELARSNVDLFEANRLKSEFLTNVTHELRTPLNAIIGFADLAAETAKDPKQQRYAENIRTSAKQLLDLINDLLDLAKIEAGKLVLREEKVNVADVCEALANFIRPLAQKKSIALDLQLEPNLPLVTTDPGRFQQILYNFLSNAVKFTPSEGQITIAAKIEPAESPSASPAVRVSITDTGPGISPDDQKVIFEKFRQIDGSVTRQHSGTGLGLAISRELANMLGGRIDLQSAPNKGATFSLILPIANPQRHIELHPAIENI